jgi:hypothetical protein
MGKYIKIADRIWDKKATILIGGGIGKGWVYVDIAYGQCARMSG